MGHIFPMISSDAFLIIAFVVEAIFLLLFTNSCISLSRGSWHETRVYLQAVRMQLKDLWSRWCDAPRHASKELDLMRCRLTRQLWLFYSGINLYFLFSQQWWILLGQPRTTPPELDFVVLGNLAVELVWQLKPNMLNPRSLDLWYCCVSLLSNVTLIPAFYVDAKDIFILTFPARYLFSVLAPKYVGSLLFCTAISSAQIIWMQQAQKLDFVNDQRLSLSIFWCFFIPLLGIFAGRRVLNENVNLRVKLEKKSMELGAVSSLLLVCYDAVAQVDESLNFMEDSLQLSGFLLCGATGKLEGKSLLQFFAHEDQDRISQQFATSEAPVQAMKVEMLDSDQNHVKVELLHARFQNHLKENCFLIGVRELQNVESFAPLPPLPPSPVPVPDSPCARRTSRRSRSSRSSRRSSSSSSSRASLTSEGDLQIWFDVDTLGILACSNDLEKLVKSLQLPRLKSILDISSSPSRESLKHDLQHLCDAYHTNSQDGCSLSLNIPGLGDVESHLHIQEKMLASLRLKGPPCMTNQEGAESPPNNQSTAHYSFRILSRSTGESSSSPVPIGRSRVDPEPEEKVPATGS